MRQQVFTFLGGGFSFYLCLGPSAPKFRVAHQYPKMMADAPKRMDPSIDGENVGLKAE